MSTLRPFPTVTSLMLATALLVASGSDSWKTFESKRHHFTARYPASWYRIRQGDDMLEIINFPPAEMTEGVILSASGALIQVGGPPPEVRSVQDWIRVNLLDDVPISESEIVVPNPAPGGCRNLRRVLWRSEVGDGKYYFYSGYYCSVRSRLYSVALMNWDGDPNQAHLQELALKVALSLRAR